MLQKNNLLKLMMIFSFMLMEVGAQEMSSATEKQMHTADSQLQAIAVGLPLNATVPDLQVVDSMGKAQTLAQLQGKKGTVLVFYRSADWCPYCKKHLIEINQWYAKIKALGFEVVGISYDTPETLQAFMLKESIKFPLLADQDAKTMRAFQILHADYQPGMKHYGIPYPGIMVVNTQGKLLSQYFYEGYKQRVELAQLYQQLAQIE